ncbi:MAG TPA: PH domain-containing protein [Tepidisphaeraceae bacterium]|nr:PH domain-containing protein [Tepidisphaeraceae bacterium]
MTQPNDNIRPLIPTGGDASTPGAAGVGMHRSPGDDEIVYYEGRPTLRADQAKVAFWLLVGLALLALPVIAWLMEWPQWRWWMTLACIVIAVVVMIVPWIITRATRYRITNYRIDFERGVLTKRIDTLELWHVDDISFAQGLVDRMMNVGSIIIVSDDRTSPRLELHGIPEPRKIFDALKQRVIAVKRQRGVVKMDAL